MKTYLRLPFTSMFSELADAIEVLCTNSCVYPTLPLLRSLFEAYLSMHYLMEKKTLYKRRAYAWMVANTHARIDRFRKLDPQTSRGEALRRELGKDEVQIDLDALPSDSVRDAIDNSLQLLDHNEGYRRGNAEYLETKRRRKGLLNWYSLYGGPNNLRQLAAHLGHMGQYEFLYR